MTLVKPGAAGEEFDLGTLEMPLKGLNVVSGPPISLQGVTLDGKPFNLEALRGKPVVLAFWADWAPQSAACLADLHALQQSANLQERVAFVSGYFDEYAAAARGAVRDLRQSWSHIQLEGAARADVTEQLGVDTLPATLLLDAQGRVSTRDLEGKRLRNAVERLLAQTAKK